MSVITLTSDWNNNDHYTGALKGALVTAVPDNQIIDVTHQVKSFHLSQAAFIVRNSYHYFPEGSIHLICLNSSIKADVIGFEFNKHFFVTSDNGIIGLLFTNYESTVRKISKNDIAQKSFPELSGFIQCVKHLCENKNLDGLGIETNEFQQQIPLRPTIDENVITGSVIYIDSYKNLITNISKDLFERIRGDKRYEIVIQSNQYKIRKVSEYYQDAAIGELVAIFNSAGLLEIAINNGNAAELLNIQPNANVRIKFT